MVILQAIFGARRHIGIAVTCLVGAAILAPTFIGIYRHDDPIWHTSNYYRNRFAVSRNLHQALLENRDELNKFKRVVVLGVGPGQLEQSPWQRNGETAFYLKNDLHLSPQWIVLVQSDGPSYRMDQEVQPEYSPSLPVIVRNIRDLNKYRDLASLIVQTDGHAQFVLPGKLKNPPQTLVNTTSKTYAVWVANPAMRADATPNTVVECSANHKRSSVQITWNVKSINEDDEIEIWVERASARKLWFAGKSIGTALTGPWVDGGVQFDIEGASSHARLATITIGGMQCP
jgi:hypothetical protein